VAVAAVDAQAGDMMRVAERDRLRLADSGVGNVGRTLYFVGDPTQGSNDEDRTENGGARQGIRTAMKDLRHSLMRSGLRDPADRPRWLSTGSILRLEKTTHWFSELSVKLEIINNFVGICRGFWILKKKKFFERNLTEKVLSFSTDEEKL
jgi:hypothetical protein